MEEKLKFENPYKYYSYMIEACYKKWLVTPKTNDNEEFYITIKQVLKDSCPKVLEDIKLCAFKLPNTRQFFKFDISKFEYFEENGLTYLNNTLPYSEYLDMRKNGIDWEKYKWLETAVWPIVTVYAVDKEKLNAANMFSTYTWAQYNKIFNNSYCLEYDYVDTINYVIGFSEKSVDNWLTLYNVIDQERIKLEKKIKILLTGVNE